MTIDLGWILPEKLESDDRDPLFIFTVPFIQGDLGLFSPSIMFWVELLSVGVVTKKRLKILLSANEMMTEILFVFSCTGSS